MRLWPKSLFARLLGIATLSTLAALVFAGIAIGHVLERVVIRGLDERLDAQVAILARAVRPDATLDCARAVNLPEFGAPGSGWSWRVEGPGGRFMSAPDAVPLPILEGPRPRHERGPRPGDVVRGGERLHVRQVTLATPAGPVAIAASGPRRIVEAPLREAMVPLLGALALLGGALAAATLFQLRLGLRPLGTLRTDLAAVREGRSARVPADQPTELVPLATELNALLDQNAAALAHARLHVANLAHGLKTPLAAMGLKLAEGGRDPDGDLAAMLAQLDGRIRHHLGRARAAADTTRARTPLRPAVDDLVAVLRRLHADRGVAVRSDVPRDLTLAVDAQDLDEMIGNLLDNAWRHTASAIAIDAVRQGAQVVLRIADDGPGLSDAAIDEALLPGRRLDERGDGHGFGLTIAKELAELNGGGIALARGATGGLVARLSLPAAVG